jgi:hypothetical protein
VALRLLVNGFQRRLVGDDGGLPTSSLLELPNESDHPLGATAFLSSRPDEEDQEIALFANPVFAHIAFKVSALAEFRSFHARVVEKNIPIKFVSNHRASFAFYFDDPDGNMIRSTGPQGIEALLEKITAIR